MKRSSSGLLMSLLPVAIVVLLAVVATMPTVAVAFKYDGNLQSRYAVQDELLSGNQVTLRPQFDRLIPVFTMMLLGENEAPVVTGVPKSMPAGQTIAVSSLFTVSDPDHDTITLYQFSAPSGGGSINLNGATNLASSADSYLVTAADMVKLTYTASSVAGVEYITIWAFDGIAWGSGSVAITVTAPENVAGSWSGNYVDSDSAHNSGNLWLTINQSGTTLTGTLSFSGTDSCIINGAPIGGYVAGNVVSLAGIFTCAECNSCQIYIQGTLSGNTVIGSYMVNGDIAGSFVLFR